MNDNRNLPSPSPAASAWVLDPSVVMLNHGSFGACPRVVLEHQQMLRERIEAEPVRFFMRELQPLLDESREELAQFVGAPAQDLVFVRNATSAVNSVLRSLSFDPGDEILITNHEYNACSNTARFIAEQTGAQLVVVQLPIPISSPDEIVEQILEHVTDRTRLALLDHITSPTAIVMPIESLVARLGEQGVDVLVDGAHGPGMVPLELERLGAAYYTGNCHKWLCAPKGAGFLYVRPDRQEGLHPTVISHGLNSIRPSHSRFQSEFDWIGTDDPTPWLCISRAVQFLESFDRGLKGVMWENHNLAVEARGILCELLGLKPICPVEMLGSMAAMMLPDEEVPEDDSSANDPNGPGFELHPIQTRLFEQFGIEVPVFNWPKHPHLIVRVSAQLYNSHAQYEYLADALMQGEKAN